MLLLTKYKLEAKIECYKNKALSKTYTPTLEN